MAQSAQQAALDETIAELKRVIRSAKCESTDKLEDVVDTFLCSEQDRIQQQQFESLSEISRFHPK
jgi:hypothetical protein